MSLRSFVGAFRDHFTDLQRGQDCDRRYARYAQGAKNLLQPYLYGDPSQNNGAE